MEPTANEMLSDVVPSNGMDAQSAIDKVISQRQTQNVGQTETGLDEAQSAINTVIQQRKSPKTQLNSTFASVSGINPDDAAKAQQVGGAIGLGQDLTMRNAAEVKRIADQKRFEMYDLMESDPILGRQMMRREFASVAHDDIPQLTSVGALFKVAYSAATLSPFPKDVASEISQQYEGTQYQTEEALIYHWMNNNNLEEKDLNEETRKRLNFLEQNAPPPINTYLFGGLSYAAGQARSMAPEVAKYAIASGVTGGALGLAGGPLAPATVAGGVLTGIGLGATAGVGVVTSQIESGMLYKDLLRSGVPKETARTASRIGGTISGLIEMGTLGLAVAPFKMVIKKTVGDVIATRLEKTTVGSAVKTAGKYYAMSEGGEQIEELSQYATAVAVEEFAKSFTDSDYVTIFETPEGRKKFIEQMVDISYQTWKATAIIGSFGPVLNLAVDAKNIRDSAKTKQFLTDLSKNVQATKLKGRSPSALANFVAAQAQGTAAETMYVDAEEMVNVLNQSGLTVQQIDNALPGVREQLSKATSGGDIQIPTAQFAANIVGTKLEAPLMEHARLAPDAISAKQAIAQQETMQQNMKDAQAEMAVQEVTNAQFVREAKEIEKVVNDQLVAAGRPATEALFAAKLVQARAVTGAAAAGITPAQWVAQHPVPTFQSQRQATQQAPAQVSFEQAAIANVGTVTETMNSIRSKAIENAMATGVSKTKAAKAGQEAVQAWIDSNQNAYAKYKLDKDYQESVVLQKATAETTAKIDSLLSEANDALISAGFVLERDQEGTSKSRYYQKGNLRVRISDHEIPLTPERQYNRETMGEPWKDFVVAKENKRGVSVQEEKIAELKNWIAEQETQNGQQDQNILRQSAVENLQMVAERGQRVLAKNSNISKEEQVAIEASSKETGVPVSEIESAVRKTKLAHPEDQGWAPLVYSRTIIVDDKVEHEFQTIPYDFSTSQEGNALEVGSEAYTNRVASIAKSMTEEVRSVLRRAKFGDKNALNILAQAGWYKAFRSRLRQEFGGLGDLFADLLGATSPNTPVRGNYWNAIDSLRRATRGDFDALMPQWEAWADKIDPLETDLKSFFNAQLALGKTKADIRRMPEFIQKMAEVKAARKVGDELLPTKETGMKYGFNGKNVIRAMVNLWRIVKDPDTDIDRGGTAPKAVTFSGNLIGFKSRATIDVWAARNLQRLNGGKRIPSAAESGVSGELKESGVTTLQFGFGQDVFTEAVGLIRNDPELQMNDVLASINDDDLQAVVWFVEKEIWTVNDWTSVAGEGGSFELEANLSGTSKQERVTELRKIVDASPVSKDVSLVEIDTTKAVKAIEDFDNLHKDEIKELQELETEIIPKYKGSEKRKAELKKLTRPEKGSEVDLAQRLLGNIGRASDRLQKTEANRIAAKAELASLERSVDRFVGGLSIQMSMDTQGTSFVPADSDMARLSHSIKTAIYESDSSNVVLASKALSTEGRYGGVERALDLEVVAREGYNANLLWKEMLQQAKEARQDSAFLSRVLRTDEDYDPITHRPGIEIYFREATSKVELDKVLAELAKENVEFLTVVVDGRRQTAFVAGAMPSAVGVRMQYIPEFEQRYGMDNMTDMDNAAIAAKVEAKAAELRTIAAKVTAAIKGVSFAGQFWYDTQVAFSHQYQEKIDAITTTESEGIVEDAGAAVWQGQSIGSGIEDANRQIRETSLQQSSRDILSGNAARADQLGQAATGGTRGEIDPVRNLITIKNANSLTVFHELMHWFVIDLFRTATDPAASELSKSDADILLKWFGIGGSNMQERIANWNAMTLEEQRRHHETAAYNAEIWVATGRAPSVELQGVFERFRRWATRAYKSIRDDLNDIYRDNFGTDLPFLTDEVRGVFDRMLASEEQISRREAIDNFKGMYQTQEESGMSDAVWAAMQAQNAESHEMGVTQLLKETVKEMKWESGAKEGFLKKMQDAEDGFRKVIRSEESDKMGNEPVRKAERFFKTGKMVDPSGKEIEVLVGNKIDSVAVGGMYPTSTTGLAPAIDLTKLRGMTMEGGLAPDLAAEMFGFSSGDELIRALAELKPFKDELKERTDARMLDEHGGMNTEAEKEEAVNKALANEVRARMVAIENRYLTKVKTPVAVIQQGAKELARTILGRMAIKDIKPRNYVAAEARVAKDKHTAVKAMQSPETAGKSAYTRSFNEQIAAGVEESVAASEALVKSVEAIKRAQAKIDAHKKQYGDVDPAIVAAKASHQQVIQGQLAKEGYKILDEVDKALAYVKRIISDANRKKMGADHADQIEAILERFGLMGRYVAPTTRTPLATWAQVQQDIGFDIEIPDIVQESVRKNFLELTPEEFQDVIDTVKQIAHTGKSQQLVLTMDRKITFEKAKTEIVDSINANAGGRKAKTRTATTNIGRSIETLTGFFAAHLKAAIVAQIMDGGKDGGPLWNYLIRSANTAGNKETTMRAAATKRISEILDPVFKGGKMGGAGVYFPSVDRSFNRESVLTIALNMGNESNMQRLLDGEGWTIEQVMPIIQSLTAAELNAVQEVWDYSETFKAEIIEKSRRTVGREPNWIEPKPLQVMSADGQMVSLKGGYYPVKYDPRASARSQSLSAAEQALRDLKDAYIASTTRRSYTKSRVKEVYDRPLLLNLSGLYSGIGEVIHDLSWHEWLIDSNRLMRSSAFDKAVREQYGVEFKDQITSWIKDVAAGDKGANNAGEMALNYLRQGVSAAGLGFNLMSAVGQITGFAQSVVKVGAKWIGRGIAVSASDPKAAIERVYALSSFMANRGSTQFRELNEIKNMVRGENVAMKRVRVGTYFLMMQMQRMVDVPTWIGAYEKQLSINSDEKLAIAIADQAVIDSQGGGMLKDLSAIERGGPIQKLFTVFYSFMNTNLNLAVLKGMTEKNAGKWVAQQTMLWVVPVVTMYMLKKLLTPQAGDDDDKFDLKEMAKELAAEELSFLMGSFMVVREFADAAKIVTGAKTYGTDYRGPAGLRMIGDTYKFATQAAQLEFDTAFRKAAINIIGSSSGLPAAQINRTIDGIEALLEGETENITAPLFGVKKR
jgi:hypothetical protein